MLKIPDPNRSSVNNLYYQLRSRALMQGVGSYEEYADLVDELIQQKVGAGEFDKNDDLSQLQNDLERLWPDIERELRAGK